jgi:dTDP-4-dehydrorhamnose 3,5-epimerase
MGKIEVETCGIEGLKVITPKVFPDARGYFMETYNYNDFKEAGIPEVFVQDNQSASRRGVLRGLHFQKHYPAGQAGAGRERGEVFRRGSRPARRQLRPSAKWFGVLLTAENKKAVLHPEELRARISWCSPTEAEFCYKVTDFYHPNDEGGLMWNDPEIGVEVAAPGGL